MAELKVKVGIDKSGFSTGLATLENAVQGFGGKISGILAGSFSFAAIGAGITKAISQGDQLQDLANRFGLAASSLQEIGNAASLSGASLEDVASAMNKLARNAGEAVSGNENMAKAFERIGLSVTDLQSMSPQDLFMSLSKSVASGKLGMEAFAVAQDLAGRGAATLMETFAMGPDLIRETGQAMGIFGDETTLALSKASDAIKTFQNQLTLGFAAVVPYIQGIISRYQALVESITVDIAGIFSPNIDTKAREDLMAESNRLLKIATEGQKNEENITKNIVKNVDERVAQYDREAKAKEAAKQRMQRLREKGIDLDNQEEVLDARLENRKMIREAQRRRDVTPGSENFERLRKEAATDYNRVFNVPVSDEQVFRSNPGLRSGLTDIAAKATMPPATDAAKNTTLQNISGQVSSVVNKIDTLIKASGSFGY